MLAVLCLACIGFAVEAADMFTLSSPAYKDQTPMDARFTCQGAGVSPPLSWSGAAVGTKSYALIVDDPDAPQSTFVHWVLYDIPANTQALTEGASQNPPLGSREGSNDFGDSGYGGPCPPSGRHRYFHTLYALDVVLPDLHNPDKARLLAAIKGHVVGETQLIGTYQKH